MPTGAENVRSWGQTGIDRPTLKTALLTRCGHLHPQPGKPYVYCQDKKVPALTSL